MSKEIEIEKTYLAKFLPEDIDSCDFKEMKDLYLPKNAKHAHLRIRKNGDSFTITKKEPVEGEDSSIHVEHSIKITKEEFEAFEKVDADIIEKKRYYYPYQGRVAEIDIFLGKLKGLVLVDFEFGNKEDLNNFKMPDFCLADVTQEDFVAGGILCHGSIELLSNDLKRFGYKKTEKC
jgi:CYTH domain-containing protein